MDANYQEIISLRQALARLEERVAKLEGAPAKDDLRQPVGSIPHVGGNQCNCPYCQEARASHRTAT